ncbi:MAG: WD40 repeat domain-containing protein, partial [Methanomassiliicoccales archaeon]
MEELEKIRSEIHDEILLKICGSGKHTIIKPLGRLTCANPAYCVAFGPHSDFVWAVVGSEVHEINLELLKDLGGSAIREENVTALAISPDGYFALSGNEEGVIRAWSLRSSFGYDAPHWLIRLWIEEFGREIRAGQQIRVMQGQEGLKTWRGELLPRAHEGVVNAVAIFPDRCFGISGGDDHLLKFWDLQTGNEIKRLRGHTGKVTSIAISSDGYYVLSGSWDGTIRLWAVSEGRELLCLQGHDKFVTSVSFVPKSWKAISGSTDTTIRVWDLKSGREVGCLKGHTDSVNFVAVSPNGQYAVSGGDDKTVRFWDIRTGREISRLEEHTERVTCVAFSPKRGQLLSASEDCHYSTLTLWSVRYPMRITQAEKYERFYISRVEPPQKITDIQRKYLHLLTSAKSCLRVGDASGAYRLLREAQSLSGFERDKEIIRLLSLCGTKGQRVALRDAWPLREYKGHKDEVTSVAIAPDSCWVASGSKDGTLRIWDIKTGQELHCFKDELYEIVGVGINAIAITPNQKYVLSGSYGGICIWDLEMRSEHSYEEGHPGGIVTSLVVSADGRYAVSAGDDWKVVLWDLDTGVPVNEWEIPYSCVEDAEAEGCYVKSLAIFPDGYQAVGGCRDWNLRIWNLVTGARIDREEAHLSSVESVSVSPDGTTLLSASSETLAIWKRTRNKQIRYIDYLAVDPIDDLDGIDGDIWSIVISPDGHYTILGGSGKSAPIYDLRNRKKIYRLKGQSEEIRAVAISRDSHFVVCGNSDGTLVIWALDWDYDFPDPADWDEGARP